MLWVLLAVLLLSVVFLRRMVLPMLFGFLIGAMVYFAAPMLQFEASAMQIVFCGMAGLMLGLVRTFIWLPAGKKE